MIHAIRTARSLRRGRIAAGLFNRFLRAYERAMTNVPSDFRRFFYGIACQGWRHERRLTAQFVEQRLSLFQIGGVEALGEPGVNLVRIADPSSR